jgi:MFS family permease
MTFKEALKTRAFWILVIMFNLVGVAAGNILTFYKTFGQTFIADDDFFTNVGTAASLANAFGRLGWGFLADKIPSKVHFSLNSSRFIVLQLLRKNNFTFKLCILIVQTLLLALISTFYCSKIIGDKLVYAVWVVAIYLAMSGIPSTLPSIMSRTFGQKHFKAIYGFVLFTYV